MGNQLSNESGSKGHTRTFGRTGALGLSKQELERRCKPSGLYPSCYWEDKAIRRLIGDGRLAARLKGSEGRKNAVDQECPICFLNYEQINITLCCKANICTECFLQVRPQKEKYSVCPFCNNPKMYVTIARKGDVEKNMQEEMDRKRIEAEMKARKLEEEATAAAAGTATDATAAASAVTTGGFGSNLEQDPAVQRARARTMSTDLTASENELQLIRQLSLSSCDRTALEREMRAQHTHPLALQMEAEAAERRIANEREYHRNNPHRAYRNMNRSGSLRNRLSRMNPDGSRSRRNWSEVMENFENAGGNREDISSLDDLVVMEAALMLSMEEDGRNRPPPPSPFTSRAPRELDDSSRVGSYMSGMSRRRLRGTNSARQHERSLTEDEQVAMAIQLSMQEHRKEKEAQEEEEDNDNKGDTDEQKEAAKEETTEEEQVVFEKVETDAPKESAPPKPAAASLPTAAGSFGAVSSGDDDDDLSAANNNPTDFKGKTSMDDSEYYRQTGTNPDDDAISEASIEDGKLGTSGIETIHEGSASEVDDSGKDMSEGKVAASES